MKTRQYLRAVRPQLTVVGLVLALQLLSLLSVVPTPEALSAMAVDWLSHRGLLLVAIASFAENFAGLGTYFPGSVALVAAMALTAGHPAQALLTYTAVVIPAIAANMMSYALGRSTREKVPRSAPRSARALVAWYFATYWHPQLAGVTAMASAAEGVEFRRYVTFFLPISVFWSAAWALLLYNVGGTFASPRLLTVFFYVYLAAWLLWGLEKHRRSVSPVSRR